jgi:hypothetical protein
MLYVDYVVKKNINTSNMNSQMANLSPSIAEHAEHAVYEIRFIYVFVLFSHVDPHR